MQLLLTRLHRGKEIRARVLPETVRVLLEQRQRWACNELAVRVEPVSPLLVSLGPVPVVPMQNLHPLLRRLATHLKVPRYLPIEVLCLLISDLVFSDVIPVG